MKALRTQLANQKLPAAGGALLLWVALAPFIWGYSTSPAAVASHVFFPFAFGPVTLIILNLRAAAYVLTGAGIWLALSPWLLGYATNHTAWLSDGVSGIMFTMLAAHAAGSRILTLTHQRRQSAATPPIMKTAGCRS
ncbi:MAG: SPW repeat protein [Solirubrobacteraceae bacterium]